MALTAGTNSFTQAQDAIRALIAKSTAFRTFLGAADEAAAQAKIYTNEVPRSDDDTRDDWSAAEYVAQFPCAIVTPPEDGKWFVVEMDARDTVPRYKCSFVFVVCFEAFADPTKDEQESWRLFENLLYDGLEDCLNNAIAEPGVFLATQITPLDQYRKEFRGRSDLGNKLTTAIQFEAIVR